MLKKILKFIFSIEAWHGLLTNEFVAPWLWPSLGVVLVGVAHYFTASPVPLPYLIAAMALTFGGIAGGIANVSSWRSKITIDGKLVHSQPYLEAYTDANNQALNAVKLGFIVNNLADYPIEFKVDELYTEIGARVPSGDSDKSQTYEVPPTGQGWYLNGAIDLKTESKVSGLSGKIQYKVTYWRKGQKSTALLEKLMHVALQRLPSGDLTIQTIDQKALKNTT
ncbi:hypothetical protein SAMN05444358_10994 [Ruegeria halocynthiae]|uniref:Uncharacterized protein n=1 Tax=Ruegeria halocynthiae TaxID=985054 RepID=A0A1H3DVA4_9RHOB|nr:hypothetical protein [Ruegeria halocynthiae]SDX70048.1 hypothetical protein SAMN05444358_10994 [Ruegeria halocynthiae]